MKLPIFVLLALITLTTSWLGAQTVVTTADFGKPGLFKLTDMAGKPFPSQKLQGKVWIASFVFTRCTGPCPAVTATMARLQEELKDIPNLQLVTFTVDPERDDPAELTRYAANFQADPSRWTFLTGTEKEIHGLMKEGFKLGISRPKTPVKGQEFDHSTKIVLVDGEGTINGYFQGVASDLPEEKFAKQDFEDNLTKLKKTALILVQGKVVKPAENVSLKTHSWYYPSPELNASLNGLAGVILVMAFIAIKRGKRKLHGLLMLLAILTSAVFLTSYLVYHLLIKEGIATRFGDVAPKAPDAIRYLYYLILVSHIILAVLVMPMALWSAYLGAKARLEKHRKLARITFPIWLYVSITGVVVYWMLYHLPGQAGWRP